MTKKPKRSYIFISHLNVGFESLNITIGLYIRSSCVLVVYNSTDESEDGPHWNQLIYRTRDISSGTTEECSGTRDPNPKQYLDLSCIRIHSILHETLIRL
ncbi:hypothetical protein NPIL_346631 [Nephila pilipes]|uniref:Uncharacterized protein n=1 Tax=Nephila pilipes TaxID=299642 RepID=A0A8X6MZC0_NEPPI|nr:hypothetical protein NPIL_346631 [Nephila pilipes]